MGRIKKSKSIISNSSNCFNKNLLNRSPKKTIIDIQSSNIINIKNINEHFFTPLINRDFHKTINSYLIISLLEANRKFDNTGGIVSDFLIKAVSIGENNLKLFANAEAIERELYHVQQQLKLSKKTINELNTTINNFNNKPIKNYLQAEIDLEVGELETVPILSHIAKQTGNYGIIKCYYYALYHGGYDATAVINYNNLAKTAKLLEAIGFTPDPCTGVSPAFMALQKIEQTLKEYTL